MKKLIFIFIILLNLLVINAYSYNCTYDWQHNPPWLCDVNNTYYDTWNECNAYCYVAEDQGGSSGNGQLTQENQALLSGIAGLLSAFLITYLWSNMM